MIHCINGFTAECLQQSTGRYRRFDFVIKARVQSHRRPPRRCDVNAFHAMFARLRCSTIAVFWPAIHEIAFIAMQPHAW
jgi:hypothetical protein